MRLKLHFIIIIFSFILASCSLSPNELKLAEKIMDTSPDSALHLLQKMQSVHSMSDASRAMYGLLYFQALEKSSKPLQPDSLIQFSFNYYQKSNDKSRLAYCYYYKARILKLTQSFDNATMLYLKALDCCQDKKNNYLLGKIYADMGDICSFQMDYNEALRKYQISIDYFTKAHKTNDISYRIVDIGRTYSLMKNYDTALIYYKKVINQSSDPILLGTVTQEIGINYYTEKKYDSAEYYLRKCLLYPYKGTNFSIRNYYLSDMYFNIEKYDSACLYANQALRYPASFMTRRECYRLLANTEYIKGNFKQMAIYMTQFQAFSDSVRKIESQTRITVLEDLYQTSEKANTTRKFLIVLGWILPFVFSIGFYIVYRLRKRNKGKEKQLIEAEVQLTQKQSLLIDSLIQKIEEKRSQQTSLYKKSSLAEREQMLKELYNSNLYLNDWNQFKQLMNKIFNNLISNLEQDCNEITHKEYIWACLYLLNIPTPEILLVLELQTSSLYKLKQRLAQKLKLKSTKNLDQLLKQLSTSHNIVNS
jgi:tetratricopeptide (TPR) repeat protein